MEVKYGEETMVIKGLPFHLACPFLGHKPIIKLHLENLAKSF
jgi:hypothetical protein